MKDRPFDMNSISHIGAFPRRSRRLRDDPIDTVVHLVDTMGPRGATALGEAQAAAYFNGRLRRAGLDVSAEVFRTRLAPGWDAVAIAGISLVGIMLGGWLPLPALLLFVAASGWAWWLVAREARPLLGRERESQNVIGIRAIGSTTARWRLVVLAPLDSPPAINTFMQPLAVRPRATVVIALAAMALLGCGAVWWYTGRVGWWYAQWLPLVLVWLLAGAQLMVLRARPSPGAAHHAGALAVLLSAVEELVAMERVEVWAVGVGAATRSSDGMADLLRRYPFEQESTLFVSLEGLGSGTLCFLTREGMLREHVADPLLLQLVTAADKADPLVDVEPRPLRSHTLLGHALHHAGRRVLTITCLNEDGSMPNAGSMRDVPATIDAPTMERAVRLVVGIVQQLDTLQEEPGTDEH